VKEALPQWVVLALRDKEPGPDPTPEQMAENDALCGPPAGRKRKFVTEAQLRRPQIARRWMDVLYGALPNLEAGQDFWDRHEIEIFYLIRAQTSSRRQAQYLLDILKQFYPTGPRYVQPRE
jgi:hypothetical protein